MAVPRQEADERPTRLAAQIRASIVGLVRAVPIRWRILSIASLNSAVVVVLVALIWNGAQVLGSAWDDVRQVRESDKILALLESETGRLQNLIHRYINQPSPELFAEILLLREAVLGTLSTRASTDPMLSGSVEELERVTERFLNGFGELLRQSDKALPQRRCAYLQPLQRQPLQVVVSEVGHDGDGLLDGLGAAAGFLGRGGRERKIVGICGDQHRGECFARFAKRWPDQRVALSGGALDDRVEFGHLPRRTQYLLVIGGRNCRLYGAQLAKSVEEAFGDALKLLHRSR